MRQSTAFIASVLVLSITQACGGSADPGADGTTPGSGGAAAGAGGSSGGSVGQGGISSTGGACNLTFSFTTLDNHGRYSPNNVSAVWVMDPNGAFVRTLEENGYIRQGHLVQWVQASQGSKVDAVTGATNRAPRTHQVAWNCTDLNQASLPPGTYTMNAEFATDNGGFLGIPAPFLSVPFDVGGGTGATTQPDAQYFTGITILLQ